MQIVSEVEIVGFEGLYTVDELGQVRSLRTGKVLNPMWTGQKRKQYGVVALCRDGTETRRKVHHIVLEAFHGSRPDGAVGCHRDDDSRNNAASNLYWGTLSDNCRDVVANGNHPNGKLTHQQRVEIAQRRLRGECGRRLAEEFGVSEQHVSSLSKGRVKTVPVGVSA